MHLISQGHYQWNGLLPGKEPERCWAPAARYGRRPLPATWRFPSFLQLCKVTVFQQNGTLRGLLLRGVCVVLTENCKESVKSKLLFSRGEGEATRLPGSWQGRGAGGWKGSSHSLRSHHLGSSCCPRWFVGVAASRRAASAPMLGLGSLARLSGQQT